MARRKFRNNQRSEPVSQRSFQEYILNTPAPQTTRTELLRLIRDDEMAEADDLAQLLNAARDAYLGLCAQNTVARALESGDALFEVPFSVRVGSSQMILRGTFDCLIRRRDAGILVLELKTGRPAPEHERQLDIYVTAAKAMFPGTPVEGKLVYAREADMDHRPLDAER